MPFLSGFIPLPCSSYVARAMNLLFCQVSPSVSQSLQPQTGKHTHTHTYTPPPPTPLCQTALLVHANKKPLHKILLCSLPSSTFLSQCLHIMAVPSGKTRSGLRFLRWLGERERKKQPGRGHCMSLRMKWL